MSELNSTDINKLIYKLRKKLWKTYQTRIITSERLSRNENFYQKINVYYSIIIVIFSIFDILEKKISIMGIDLCESKKGLSLIVLVSSIISAIFTMFISSKGYKERSINMKMHYIDLKDLFYELTFIDKKTDTEKLEILKKVQETYSKLLKTVENHSSFDYLKFRMENHEKNSTITEDDYSNISNKFFYSPPSFVEIIKYYLYVIWNWIIVILLILGPFLTIYFLNILGSLAKS